MNRCRDLISALASTRSVVMATRVDQALKPTMMS